MAYDSDDDLKCPVCHHVEARPRSPDGPDPYDDGVPDICPRCAAQKLMELGVPVMFPIGGARPRIVTTRMVKGK